MFTPNSMLTLVSALVGAGAYGTNPHDEVATASPSVQQAVACIHHARVDIYCDHGEGAVADIRAARQHLNGSTGVMRVAALTALDQAAWFARNDDYSRAELALDKALAMLADAAPA